MKWWLILGTATLCSAQTDIEKASNGIADISERFHERLAFKSEKLIARIQTEESSRQPLNSNVDDDNERDLLYHDYGLTTELLDQPLLVGKNKELHYRVLVNTPHGRHLLMVSLLEQLSSTYWTSRCGGKLKIFLPESLRSPDQPPPPPGACMLENIMVDGAPVNRDWVKREFYKIIPAGVDFERFSWFKDVHKRAIYQLAEWIINIDRFGAAYSLLVVIKELLSRQMFVELVNLVLLGRGDTGFTLPSMETFMPELFFREDIIAPIYLSGTKNTLDHHWDEIMDTTGSRENEHVAGEAFGGINELGVGNKNIYDTGSGFVNKPVEARNKSDEDFGNGRGAKRWRWTENGWQWLPSTSSPQILQGTWIRTNTGWRWEQRETPPPSTTTITMPTTTSIATTSRTSLTTAITSSTPMTQPTVVTTRSTPRTTSSTSTPRTTRSTSRRTTRPTPTRPWGTDGMTWTRVNPREAEWYFREDPVANAHHSEWHRVVTGPRRGELFYFMHDQMLARYEAERLSLGMNLTRYFMPNQWDRRVFDSYNPRLGSEWAQRWPGTIRAGEMHWLRRTTDNMAQRAVQYSQGEDRGIDWFGTEFENGLHNRGHEEIAALSWNSGGVMMSTAVAMRDPIFFRWHGYVHSVFQDYKNRLAQTNPYTDRELSFPGVRVVSSNVVPETGDLDTFYTYREMASVRLDSLDSTGPGRWITVQYMRLNHRPFRWNIVIESDLPEPTPAIVRIFMMPNMNEVGNRATIHMDHFFLELSPGINNVSRDELQAPHLSKSRWSLSQLQDSLMNGQIGQSDFSWGGCGWPRHLNVPRGIEEGMQWSLVVMVSRVLPQDMDRLGNWRRNNRLAWSYCGVRNGMVPDSRPMGFPVDRDFQDINDLVGDRENWLIVPVTIRHGRE